MFQTIKYWISAARLRTLPASISPVFIACGLAWKDARFSFIPALMCLLVAILAQVASNYANDYFDYVKGADGKKRRGPSRAVASGQIAPRKMLCGALITLCLACICGLVPVFMRDWRLIFVGIAVALGVLAYSGGKYPLAYKGLGDICVLLFYGIIPLCFTYYVQALTFTWQGLFLGASVGLLSVNILVVNNYRDYKEDMKSGKRTSIVIFGRKFGRRLYIANGVGGTLLALPFLFDASPIISICIGILAVYFAKNWMLLYQNDARLLNKALGRTALHVFLFSILITIALVS